MSDIQRIKQRFGIIGNNQGLNRAIDVARQVASTDLTVLITGESGVGKEVFPQIVHQFSARKHGPYIAVNCGAIPEGTIDSELFGHEKGAFTGAHDSRKGYFEEANVGTIFLDEVADLPLSTQVRLLRVLETGEFIRVGSSKVIKTDVRVVAATNIDVQSSIQKGKFREDLYYRLNTVPIFIPPLKDRKEDIYLLFRKFASDFAEKYHMPPLALNENAQLILEDYRWPGNIRQLKNITEQMSVIEESREIDEDTLRRYLPDYYENKLPALYSGMDTDKSFNSEREILYKVLFEMKRDMNDMKKLVYELMQQDHTDQEIQQNNAHIIRKLHESVDEGQNNEYHQEPIPVERDQSPHIEDTEEIIEESLSLQDKEIEFIQKALAKHNGKRKNAADELGISERTLYRKIKEYNLE